VIEMQETARQQAGPAASRFDELFHDDTYIELKNRLFSYTLRRRHVGRLLGSPEGIVLDVGSGISPVAPARRNTLYADVWPEAMQVLSTWEPEASFAVADAVRMPLRAGAVDAVVCSEVLEHIERDVDALREFQRVLRPGGVLTITFPIHPYYYTFDDSYVGHFRRYRLEEMLSTLAELGFRDCRVRKIAGVLEKAATYLMVRGFNLLSKDEAGRDGEGRKRPWWRLPYLAFNAVWSRVCELEARVEPLALITIVSVQCRKG
jgi:ubiquinone/menaquinone biosynthesis C-methylase UbiE